MRLGLGLALRHCSVPREERYHRQVFSAKNKQQAWDRNRFDQRRRRRGVNQPVLNLSWVLPTSQLDACEALWVNQSRLDFTASNNTFG
jgi:hypothetical protein